LTRGSAGEPDDSAGLRSSAKAQVHIACVRGKRNCPHTGVCFCGGLQMAEDPLKKLCDSNGISVLLTRYARSKNIKSNFQALPYLNWSSIRISAAEPLGPQLRISVCLDANLSRTASVLLTAALTRLCELPDCCEFQTRSPRQFDHQSGHAFARYDFGGILLTGYLGGGPSPRACGQSAFLERFVPSLCCGALERPVLTGRTRSCTVLVATRVRGSAARAKDSWEQVSLRGPIS
jgi:hypothetical protein